MGLLIPASAAIAAMGASGPSRWMTASAASRIARRRRGSRPREARPPRAVTGGSGSGFTASHGSAQPGNPAEHGGEDKTDHQHGSGLGEHGRHHAHRVLGNPGE